MKKYPFVKQVGNNDCGVACLSMIIQYHQGYVPSEKLRELTKTTQTGVTAYNLINGAESLGFYAKGLKGDLSELEGGEIQTPFIAHVFVNQDLGHYIVVYKIDKNKKTLLIADPSDILEHTKTISYSEFKNIWSGVIITLIPYKKLPLYNQTFSFKDFMFSICSSYKNILIQLFLLSIFITIFSILQSFFFDFFLNKFSITKEEEPYFFLFYLFIGIILLKQITNHFRNNLLIKMNTNIDYFIHHDIFSSLIYLPYRFYRTHTTGEITSKLNDLEYVKSFIGDFVTSILVDSFLSIVCFIILCFLNIKLALISLTIAFIYVTIQLLFNKTIKNFIKQVQLERANQISYAVESIHNFQTIKGLNIERHVINNYENKYRSYTNKMYETSKTTLKQGTLKETLMDISSLIILFIGILEILKGNITFGKLVSIQMLSSYFFIPFQSIFSIAINYQEVKSILEHLTELLYQDKKTSSFNIKTKYPIEFNNLIYSYNDNKHILKNITLKIDAKEKIMLVGSSGGGKSTLMKLLLRYFPVERAQILIGENDINDISDEEIEKFISYVSQEETLFTGTLWYNLTLNRDIDEEKVLEIARICEVDKIANQTPSGYHRVLEENGFRLSGGEKERIILARSLLKNCSLLVIDEGMGQMDVNQERRIIKNILSYDQTLTIILVSHRLDNQDLFDRVIELENGIVRKDIKKNE